MKISDSDLQVMQLIFIDSLSNKNPIYIFHCDCIKAGLKQVTKLKSALFYNQVKATFI